MYMNCSVLLNRFTELLTIIQEYTFNTFHVLCITYDIIVVLFIGELFNRYCCFEYL